MRKAIVVLAGVAILVLVNVVVMQRERLLADGRVVFLELAPVDPRSLMQGDYMALAFADAVARPPADITLPTAGVAIVALDARNVAAFARLDDGAPLAADEARLRFTGRTSDGGLDFGTDAFFFQEGDADRYAQARYGVFRVDEAGNAVLVGLADETGQEIPRPAE